MNNPPSQSKLAALLLLAVATALPAGAADLYKADNADSLDQATSWTNNVAPTGADNLIWDATVTLDNTTNDVPGFELNVNSVKVLNPAGPIVINGTGPLSVNQFDGLSQPTNWTQDIVFNCAVTFTGTGYKKIVHRAGQRMTINGDLIISQLNLDGDAGSLSANAELRLAGGGFGVGTEPAGVQFKGSSLNLGVGSSSSDLGGPLGTNVITWSANDRNLFAFNGAQTLSNAISMGNNVRFGGSDNLTLAGNIAAGSSRTIDNLGVGTLIFSGPITSGAIQVNAGTVKMTGNNTTAADGTQAKGTGNLVLVTGGSHPNNRIRKVAGSKVTVEIASAAGQYTVKKLQTDGVGGFLEFAFGSIAPSTTTPPLVTTDATGSFTPLSASGVIISGTPGNFSNGSTYPLVAWTGSTAPNMNNLTLSAQPSGVLGYLTNDATAFLVSYVVTNTGAGPTPPTITVDPQNTSAVEGGSAQFSVTAIGDAPLTYLWSSIISGVTNSVGGNSNVLVLNSVSAANEGSYFCVVTNLGGADTSASAALNVILLADLPANAIWWNNQAANADADNPDNYSTNSSGSGGAPVSIDPNVIVELWAFGNVNNTAQDPNVGVNLACGAYHGNVNFNKSFLFLGGSSSGTWTFTGADVPLWGTSGATINNAFFVNETGKGCNFKPSVVLDGGGDFVLYHNGNGNFEFDSQSISEVNGSANLIFDGGKTIQLRGNPSGTGSLTTSGDLTIKGTNTVLECLYDFDISAGGGAFYIDPNNVGAKINLDGAQTLTVAYLVVDGTALPAATYDSSNLPVDSFTGSGDQIVVTIGGVPPGGGTPTGSTIASTSLAGNILSLTLTNGLANGVFHLLQSGTVNFTPFTTNQSGTFDGSGNANVTVTNTGGNSFLRVAEPTP